MTKKCSQNDSVQLRSKNSSVEGPSANHCTMDPSVMTITQSWQSLASLLFPVNLLTVPFKMKNLDWPFNSVVDWSPFSLQWQRETHCPSKSVADP